MTNTENNSHQSITIQNEHINTHEIDYYFHLYLDSSSNIERKFGRINYVFYTGRRIDADDLSLFFQLQLTNFKDIPKVVAKDDRFRIYIVANCVIVSHELGASSLSILLQELTKVLSRVNCPFRGYIKFGRTWSFNESLGTIIISEKCINERLKSLDTFSILGKKQRRKIKFCPNLRNQFRSLFKVLKFGKIIGVNNLLKSFGFSSTEIIRKDLEEIFIKKLKSLDVKQFDLESHIFGSFCGRLGIPCMVLGLVSGNLTKTKYLTLDPLFKLLLLFLQKKK